MPKNHIVFDIETVPFPEKDYSETQRALIAKRLASAISRNSNIGLTDESVKAEAGKIKGTDPYLSRIVCIGLLFPETNKRLALTNESEKAILDSFWNIIAGFSGIFVSYNGVKFDVPFIMKRSMLHGLAPTNLNFLKHTKYSAYPPHFDVMQQYCGRDTFMSLKEMCDMMSVPSPKEGSVSSSTVGDAYYAGRIQEIAEYCLRDLDSTYALYKIMCPYILP